MKRKIYQRLGISILLLLVVMVATAQQRTITGTVKDPTGMALPGVSVLIKGATSGTVTDSDGIFSISVRDTDVLVFSFIGYEQQEVATHNQTLLNIVLKEDVKTLGEVQVVAIGYGESKRADVTGAISSVSGDEIRKRNVTTFDQALQGKVAGVVVQQISGQPGGGVSIQIRGLSSFGGVSPLYVIDGVIIGTSNSIANAGSGTNPLAGINPSDIESIDVLKDASATAIYGSQASNGVIIITTKRGHVAAPRISYDFYSGFQQLPRRIPTMNLQEYATFLNERNTGLGWGFDTRPNLANPQYLGKGTDWQKELFRNAPQTSHNISVSGGDTRTQYLFSGSYFRQEGIALGSNLTRLTARLNLDNKTTDWLKIGTSLQLANIKENVNSTSSNVINSALSQTPDIAVKNPDGSWGGNYNPNGWVNPTVNPYAIALINKDQITRNQLFGNAYAEITFLPGLTLRNEATAAFSMAIEDKFNPSYVMGIVKNNLNSGSYSYTQSLYTTIRNYLTFAHVFATRYNANVMVGHEAQLNRGEGVSASRSNFPSNNVQALSSGDPLTATNSGTKNQNAQESYFGRLNFALDDKYLLTVNVREDGSSRFAAGNRWVSTYSAAVAWKMHNEGFLKGIRPINELKLRVGYGLTNNQNIGDVTYLSTLSTISNGLSGVAQYTNNLPNPNVKWETTKYGNIGLDGAILDWRINFSVDFYNRRTDGLLMQIPLPMYSGTATSYAPGTLDAPYVNVGSVNNQGFDFRISSTNIRGGDFSWKTDLTVSRNVNKVMSLNTDGASLPGQYSKTVVGRSIGEFYGYQVDGVFANASDFETHALPVKNGLPISVGAAGGSIWYGDLMFKDINGDGIIDASDQTYLGSPIPKVQLGLNNTFSYKNFDLTIFFSSNIGNKVYNQLRVTGEYPGTSYGYFKALNDYAKLALIDPNGSATDINNVYVTNPHTLIVGIRNDNTNDNNRTSNKFVEDGTFVRCKNIALGYTLPTRLVQKAHISSLRVYANVSNAFLITKYKGMDPEIGSWNPLNAGIDNGFYPQSRVFTIGANLQLGN